MEEVLAKMYNVVEGNCCGILMNKVKRNDKYIYIPVSLELGMIKEKTDERKAFKVFMDREQNNFILASERYTELEDCNYAVGFTINFYRLINSINPDYKRYAIELFKEEMLNKVFIPSYVKELDKYLLFSESEIEYLNIIVSKAKETNSDFEDIIVNSIIAKINFNLRNNPEVYDKVFNKVGEFATEDEKQKVISKTIDRYPNLELSQKNLYLRKKIGPRF